MENNTHHAHLIDTYLRLPADDSASTLTFIVTHRDALLTPAAETAVNDRLRHITDEAKQSRLRELADLIQQLRQAAEAVAGMPTEERLFFAFASVPNRQALDQFVSQLDEDELRQLETLVGERVANLQARGQDEDAEKLQERLNDLRQIHSQLASLSSPDKILLEWLRTPGWESSQAFLTTHTAELMNDETEARLAKLLAENPDDPMLSAHQWLLAKSRAEGIVPAYAARRQLQEQEIAAQNGPLGMAVTRFATVENDADASVLLQQEADLLLTWEAGNLLKRLIALAVQSENRAVEERLQVRHAQWLAALVANED